MNDYFHAECSRADAAAKLLQLQADNDDDEETFVLFRTGSEPGTYALSTISEHGKIRHYKVRALDHRLGVCDADGEVKNYNYMDVNVFLRKVQDMGTLVRAPNPTPLFLQIK